MIKFDATYIKRIIKKNFIIYLGVFAIIPFITISIFNNPSADDFCFNVITDKIGYWEANWFSYNNWNGRYLTTSILTIKGLLSGSFVLYKIIPIVLFSVLFFAIYYLFSVLFEKIKKQHVIVFVFFFLIMLLVQMPSISQGFYWLPSSISYQLSNILSIIFFSFFIKLIKENKIKHLLLSSLFLGLVIGGNETSMLLINFLLFAIFAYRSINNKKIEKSILIVFIFAIIFSIIVFISPGNSVRSSNLSNNHQLLDSFLNSLVAFKKYVLYWLPFIIIFVLYYFNTVNLIKGSFSSRLFKVNPLILCVVVFSIPVIGFFPAYWGLGGRPPLRVINTIYFFFLIGFIYLAFVLFIKMKSENKNFISYSKWVKYLLLVLIFIQLSKNNNIRTAYEDLLTGRAYQYDQALKQRYEIINNGYGTISVPQLDNLPTTIFFDDITNDSNDWRNDCYDAYFNKTIIIE